MIVYTDSGNDLLCTCGLVGYFTALINLRWDELLGDCCRLQDVIRDSERYNLRKIMH